MELGARINPNGWTRGAGKADPLIHADFQIKSWLKPPVQPSQKDVFGTIAPKGILFVGATKSFLIGGIGSAEVVED